MSKATKGKSGGFRDKSGDLAKFSNARANRYKVDTRYIDFFGRNATCAANSIFVRV